jgi:hypothetical protein
LTPGSWRRVRSPMWATRWRAPVKNV